MRETLEALLAERSLECKLLGAAGCVLAVSALGLRWRKSRAACRRMEEERQRREESVRRMEEALRTFHRQNSEVDRERVLGLTLVDLAKELQDGSLSPETALYVYVEKALEVHNDLNCVTVFLSDCDTQLRNLRESRERGPLYGVPVSIKEQVAYQGHPSTCGLVQYLDAVEAEDSVLVKVLKKQGAVVFARTNVPQSLICVESSNPIYGATLNPHNQAKSSAGSTGGEGALIGGGGSILGIGTDVGGSIRLPSSFCGIAGFKPSPKRLSMRGVRPCVDGMTTVATCIGPMAQDVDALVLAMRALLCDEMFRLDPNVPPIPFNEETFSSTKNLRIGYFEADGFFQPNPGMRRVVMETKTLLEEAGHKLIPFRPPQGDEAFLIFVKALLGDGGRTLEDKFAGNPLDPHLHDTFWLCKLPAAVKKILAFVLRPIYPRISKVTLAAVGARSVQEHWLDQIAVEEYQARFMDEWRKLELDVLLCPMLGPAFNVDYAGKLIVCASFTSLYNVLQFPAGVVPVGSVTSEDEEATRRYTGYDNDLWDKLFKKAVADGVGLPLSVQCVALPYQDELCLRLMMEVQTLHRQRMKR